MNDIIEIQIWQFSLVYLLLLVVLVVMKVCKMNQSKMLLIASIRMTVQLAIAGLIISYIFENPHPAFTIGYISIMIGFAIWRTLSKNKHLNVKFKLIIAGSLAVSGLSMILFFIIVIVGESIFNPQYVIPISGMIMGNAMTSISLGIKTFFESMNGKRIQIEALLNIGVTPKKILQPFVKQSLETALLPTLNSMIGMGIVSLPGMMTGQLLSGIAPTTAILYQIAIMIAICTVSCLTVFGALHFGHKTLYNDRNQITIL